MWIRTLVRGGGAAAALMLIAAGPAWSAPARGWGDARPAGAKVRALAIDDAGRGVALVPDGLAPVSKRGVVGDPVAVPEGAAAAPRRAAGVLDYDVATSGRVAVAVRTDATTIALGLGTTKAPPSQYLPYVTGTDLSDPQVSIGEDGRLLLGFGDEGAVMVARQAPGEGAPRVQRLTKPAEFPFGAGADDAMLTRTGASIVSWAVFAGTDSETSIAQTRSPDGPFRKREAAQYGGARYTREYVRFHERTGFTSWFGDFHGLGLFTRRLSPAGRSKELRLTPRFGRWGAGVGATGAAAAVWTRGGDLWVRRRNKKGLWDKARRLAAAGGTPAVAVDAFARVTIAYERGGRIVAASQPAGGKFPKFGRIVGSGSCRAVTIAGAPSGRALAVLGCDGQQRIAQFNPRSPRRRTR